VRVPIRVLLGGKSPEWITNAAHGLQHVLPASELVVLAGQTHMLKPKVTAPVVREYFTAGTTAASDVDAKPARDAIRRARGRPALSPRGPDRMTVEARPSTSRFRCLTGALDAQP
jgi:hypothetical protein